MPSNMSQEQAIDHVKACNQTKVAVFRNIENPQMFDIFFANNVEVVKRIKRKDPNFVTVFQNQKDIVTIQNALLGIVARVPLKAA